MSREGRLINHNKGHIAKLKVGNLEIKTGLGGLHSMEKNIIQKECYGYDVTSYYPRIILNNQFGPNNQRDDFLDIYENISYRKAT